MYVCMYLCMYTYMYIYIYIYIYCINLCRGSNSFVDIADASMCIHAYIHTYTNTYIHTYVNKCTHMSFCVGRTEYSLGFMCTSMHVQFSLTCFMVFPACLRQVRNRIGAKNFCCRHASVPGPR